MNNGLGERDKGKGENKRITNYELRILGSKVKSQMSKEAV